MLRRDWALKAAKMKAHTHAEEGRFVARPSMSLVDGRRTQSIVKQPFAHTLGYAPVVNLKQEATFSSLHL